MTSQTTAVPSTSIITATEWGMRHAGGIALACREERVPFPVALALVEQESSKGANVWGRADASPFAGYDGAVDRGSFELFYFLVTERGFTPTGVGPCQITYAGAWSHTPNGGKRDGGLFKQMLAQGLRPWAPKDNVQFGLRLLREHYDRVGKWRLAYGHYNGGVIPNMEYADQAQAKRKAWRERLAE